MLEPNELFPEVPNLYEFLSVHADMLQDDERVTRYVMAIEEAVQPGSVVLDLGAGTGLLSFLCLNAGAEHVYAIERSAAINWARTLAARNGYADRIDFIPQDSRLVDLPERVDTIVSELIGHLAFEEGMLEALIDARCRFLKEKGRVVPQSVSLRATLTCAEEMYAQVIDCWTEIHGIDVSPLRAEAVKACYLMDLLDKEVMSEPCTVVSVDLTSDQLPGSEFECILRASRGGYVNGIGLWFDATLTNRVRLSSSPWTRTHWKQCFAPIERPFKIQAHQEVRAKLEFQWRKSANEGFKFRAHLEG